MKNSPADRFSEARRCFSHLRLSFSGALRFGFSLFASVIIVVFVSGAYRHPLPEWDTSQLRQQEKPPENGTDGGLEILTRSTGGSFSDRLAINVASIAPTYSPPPLEINAILSPPSTIDVSCLSRYQSKIFLRDSPHLPSQDLVKSLRRYEALHKSCGPITQTFKKSILLLKSSSSHGFPSDCKYLVWTPENGLGNQMISLASTFLYALLSHRVLLIDRGKDLHNLFCEPFPESSWFLPLDFPLRFRFIFNKTHPAKLGNIRSTRRAAMVYAHLSHDYEDQDKRFYCEKDQNQLHNIPWMVLKSDQYFVPALFLIPEFSQRLRQLFPEKETIFHHLSRYLFHPGNSVYNLIKTQIQSNLAKSRERLGIQLRIHGSQSQTIDLVTRQIINCTLDKNLLPKPNSSSSYKKTVLITSLRPEFLGRLKRIYRSSGLRFYQPSQEGRQQTGKEEHDTKALSEIFLLGMADELLTSSWSTFGYAAQGIGGIKPWILRGPVHSFVPNPSCVRDVSMEPCFHFPPNYDCGSGEFMLTRKMLPFIKQCRDRSPGVKLVDIKRKKTSG